MSNDEIKLDLERDQRLGFGEAAFCQNKSVRQIAAILEHAAAAAKPLLLTRLDRRKYEDLPANWRDTLDYDDVSRTAFYRREHSSETTSTAMASSVAVVTAGTSDAVPARELLRTLEFNDIAATAFFDVGVAGLWRLMERLEEIRRHQVVVAVAGMDAALPSVLGGLLANPLIAVPTSTGYGAARNGETALAACLASCAPGIVVCNIDNGYGAACAAMRVLNSLKISQLHAE